MRKVGSTEGYRTMMNIYGLVYLSCIWHGNLDALDPMRHQGTLDRCRDKATEVEERAKEAAFEALIKAKDSVET
ncbi:hypothetical protein RHSIM_Rhsim11G0053600 [Rhododendron simsii]|uniref:Uncharacterized protein n=1 Tax=Rhododendron simsii TaxID=118357 RepID=A0A834G8C5_RHOSS|nr:hypothetical protein RHSIM_Rhsim11G0053600 [Rhododendron simsii]